MICVDGYHEGTKICIFSKLLSEFIQKDDDDSLGISWVRMRNLGDFFFWVMIQSQILI